jgi:transglutaminase-like putative cysteine protease
MKRILVVAWICSLFLSSCGAGEVYMPTLVSTSTKTILPTTTITFTDTKIPTSIPTYTVTPIAWNKYSFEYGFQVNTIEAWMPIPREWDNIGMRNLKIVEISPKPSLIYQDDNGNQIAHWIFYNRDYRTFKVIFEVELSQINQQIKDPASIFPYDTTTDLYKQYTSVNLAIQSDDKQIIDKAHEIVGNETNPYKQAHLIEQWVFKKITYGDDGSFLNDAISTLNSLKGDCSNRANIFVALTRALGIPARSISGLHNPGELEIISGTAKDNTLHHHVWAEFYITDIGWLPVDPGIDAFARIDEMRIVLSKGNNIHIGRIGCDGFDERSWFHTPEDKEWCGGLGPNDPMWLKVTLEK